MAGGFKFAQVTIIPVAALTGDNVVKRSTRDALVCRADLARASGVGRSGSRAGRRAVPHAGAARAARFGRFPRLCRNRHVGTRQDRREDRRCAERPRRHAEAHLHHGRRPAVRGQGRCRDAGARHRSRHLARRGALGGAAAPDQRRCHRGAAGLAVGDAVRSGGRLSAADCDRSHAGHQHERLGAGRFRDLGVDAGACLQRQRHRRLPHPARPRRGDRPVQRPAAYRQFRAGQRHRRRDRRRRRHHLGASRRAAGRRQCAGAEPRAARPRALRRSRRFARRSRPSSTGVRKRWRFCSARSEFRF